MASPAQVFATSEAEVALREGMSNFVLLTLGENLRPTIMCENTNQIEDGATIWRVIATVTPPSTGREVTFVASIPVSARDVEFAITRIADKFFKVKVDDYLEDFHFEAWCECNPHNGAMAIVRVVRPNRPDRWLVGGGMDDEVQYRGEFARMPKWAKDVAFKNFGGWIDTDGANLGQLVTD